MEPGQRLALRKDREWGGGLAGHRRITVGCRPAVRKLVVRVWRDPSFLPKGSLGVAE